MSVNNPPKLLGIIVAMVAITVLLITGSISSDGGIGLLSALIGYLVGNGVAARRGDAVESVLGPDRSG